jgi:hypothetical protein
MIKFYFKSNRKFLEQIRIKNVYGILPSSKQEICIKYNENKLTYDETILHIFTLAQVKGFIKNYYVICDNQEEYNQLNLEYTLFLLQKN